LRGKDEHRVPTAFLWPGLQRIWPLLLSLWHLSAVQQFLSISLGLVEEVLQMDCTLAKVQELVQHKFLGLWLLGSHCSPCSTFPLPQCEVLDRVGLPRGGSVGVLDLVGLSRGGSVGVLLAVLAALFEFEGEGSSESEGVLLAVLAALFELEGEGIPESEAVFEGVLAAVFD